MKSVKVNRDELKAILATNRVTHLADHEEAVAGYKEALEAALVQKLDWLRNAKTLPSQHFEKLPIPSSHEDDYERVIRMLDLSTENEIELSAQEFTQYVLDDWGWKQAFNATTMNYKNG